MCDRAWIEFEKAKPEVGKVVTIGEWRFGVDGWFWWTTRGYLRPRGDYFIESVTHTAKFAVTHWLAEPEPPVNTRGRMNK